jgi:hypothetical protein
MTLPGGLPLGKHHDREGGDESEDDDQQVFDEVPRRR